MALKTRIFLIKALLKKKKRFGFIITGSYVTSMVGIEICYFCSLFLNKFWVFDWLSPTSENLEIPFIRVKRMFN
jgi:hypothetical protein